MNGKHKLRRIKVRSTARVSGFYTAANYLSKNDNLCTVPCFRAVRDDLLFSFRSIQIHDTSQDLYEATTEINDENPCISVALQFLPHHCKCCVYVDEIYVFADPVDSPDLESQERRNENSSRCSLMAMFLPTSMQFSKTTGLSHLNDLSKEKHVSGDGLEETQLNEKASTDDPQKVKLNEVKGGWVGPSQPDTLPQVAKMETNHTALPSHSAKMEFNSSSVPSRVAIPECNRGDSLSGNVERALEQQLVSRMDRIEEICLGFQEKMVMPMNSMETRLQRVEQQLETLTKKCRLLHCHHIIEFLLLMLLVLNQMPALMTVVLAILLLEKFISQMLKTQSWM